jgi:hydrogenase maturation factor
MCFALPLRVVKIKGGVKMEDGRLVKLGFKGKIKPGDYLFCQQDIAIERLTKKQALARRKTIKGVYEGLQKGN